MSGTFTSIVAAGVYIRNQDGSNGVAITGDITQSTGDLNIVVTGFVGSGPTPGFSDRLRYSLSPGPPIFNKLFIDNGDGTYTTVFDPTTLFTTGPYTIKISDSGDSTVFSERVLNFVGSAPTTAVFDSFTVQFFNRNPTDGSNDGSIVFVEGTKTINVVVTGTLNGVPVSGEEACIQMYDPSDSTIPPAGLTFTDNGDGTYSAPYDTVNLVEGNSPYTFLAESICDSNVSQEGQLLFTAEGGLPPQSVDTIEITSITKQDKDGNPVEILNGTMYGGGDITITAQTSIGGTSTGNIGDNLVLLIDGVSQSGSPTLNGDETYTWVYTVPGIGGSFLVRIKEATSNFRSPTYPILREPLAIQTIRLSGDASYFAGGATDPGLIMSTQYVNPNENAYLYAMGFDQNGLPIAPAIGYFTVNYTGATLTSDLDQYTMQNTIGPYSIFGSDQYVSTNYADNMPKAITSSGIEPTFFTVTGDGVTSDELTVYWAGAPVQTGVTLTDNDTHKSGYRASASFFARVTDQYGTYMADQTVNIAGDDGLDGALNANVNDSTEYVFQDYTPSSAASWGATGLYTAELRQLGVPISSPEFSIWWSDIYKITLTGDGGNNTPGGTVTFTARVTDQYDNSITGLSLGLSTNVSSFGTTSTDNSDGTYTFTVAFSDDISLVPGDPVVYTATDNGTGLTGTLTITWAAVGSDRTLTLDNNNSGVYGTPVTLTATVLDSSRNAVIGLSILASGGSIGSVGTPPGPISYDPALGAMTDNSDGTYTLELPVKQSEFGQTILYTATESVFGITGTSEVTWATNDDAAPTTVDLVSTESAPVWNSEITLTGYVYDQAGILIATNGLTLTSSISGGEEVAMNYGSTGLYTYTVEGTTITAGQSIVYTASDQTYGISGETTVDWGVSDNVLTTTTISVSNSTPSQNVSQLIFTVKTFDQYDAPINVQLLKIYDSTLAEFVLNSLDSNSPGVYTGTYDILDTYKTSLTPVDVEYSVFRDNDNLASITISYLGPSVFRNYIITTNNPIPNYALSSSTVTFTITPTDQYGEATTVANDYPVLKFSNDGTGNPGQTTDDPDNGAPYYPYDISGTALNGLEVVYYAQGFTTGVTGPSYTLNWYTPAPTKTVTTADNTSPLFGATVNFTSFVYDQSGTTFDLYSLPLQPILFLYTRETGGSAVIVDGVTFSGITLTASATNPNSGSGGIYEYFVNTDNSDYTASFATVNWGADTSEAGQIFLDVDNSYSTYGNPAKFSAAVYSTNNNPLPNLQTVVLTGGSLPPDSIMQDMKGTGAYEYSLYPVLSEDGTTVVYTATETSSGVTGSVSLTWPTPSVDKGTLNSETSSVLTYTEGGVTFTSYFTDSLDRPINVDSVTLTSELYTEAFPMTYSGLTGTYIKYLTAVTSLNAGRTVAYYATGSTKNIVARADIVDPIAWPGPPVPTSVSLTSSADNNLTNPWNSVVTFTANVTDQYNNLVDPTAGVRLTSNPSINNLSLMMTRLSTGVYAGAVTGTTGSAGVFVTYIATELDRGNNADNGNVSWYYQPVFDSAVLTVDDNTPDLNNGAGQSLNFTAKTFDQLGKPFDYSTLALIDTRGGLTLSGFSVSQNTGEYTLAYPIPNEYLFTPTPPLYVTYNLIDSTNSTVLSSQIISYLGSDKLSKFTINYSATSGPPVNYRSLVRLDITSRDQYDDPIPSGATGPEQYPKLYYLDGISGQQELNTSSSIADSTTYYNVLFPGTLENAGKSFDLFAGDASGVTGPIFNVTWPLPVIRRTDTFSDNLFPSATDTINLTTTLIDEFGSPYNQPNNFPTIFVYSKIGSAAPVNTGITMGVSGGVYTASLTDRFSGLGGTQTYSANNAAQSYIVRQETDVITWAASTNNVMSLTADTTMPAFLEYVTFKSYLFNSAGTTLNISSYSDKTVTLYELANPQNTYTMYPNLQNNNGQGTFFYYDLTQTSQMSNKRIDYGLIPLDGTSWNGVTISVNWAAPLVNFAYTQLNCPSFVKQNNSYIVQHDVGTIPAGTIDVQLFTPSNQPYSGVTIPASLYISGIEHKLSPGADGLYHNDNSVAIIDNAFYPGQFPYGAPVPMDIYHNFDPDYLQGKFGATLFYNGFVFDNSEIRYQEQNKPIVTQIMSSPSKTFNYRIGDAAPSFSFVAKDVFSADYTSKDISDYLGLSGQSMSTLTRLSSQSPTYQIAGSSGLGVAGASAYSIQPYTIQYGDMVQTESADFQIFTHNFDNTSAQFTSPILPGKKATLGANTVLSYSPGPAGTVLNNGNPFIATISWQSVLSNMAQAGSTITSFSQTATWNALQQSGLTFSVDSYLQPGTNNFIINLSFPVGGYTGTIPGLPAGSGGFTLTYADPTFEFFVNGTTGSVIPKLVTQPVSVNLNYYTADVPPALWTFPDPRFSIFYNSIEYPLVPSGTQGNFRVTSGIPLITTEAGSTLSVKARGSAPGDSVYGYKIITYSEDGATGPVPCFLADAPILTPSGNVRIDSLKTGDVLVTNKGFGFVKNLRSYKVPAAPHTNPYRIPLGTYGASQDLLISPLHGVQVGNDIIPAKNLGLEQVQMTGNIHYFNVELDKWHNMYVAGVEVESLAPPAWAAIVDSLALMK